MYGPEKCRRSAKLVRLGYVLNFENKEGGHGLDIERPSDVLLFFCFHLGCQSHVTWGYPRL